MLCLVATLARHARPCAGHPRPSAAANFASLSRRRGVDGRDKPGHDAQGLYRTQTLAFLVRISISPDSPAARGRRETRSPDWPAEVPERIACAREPRKLPVVLSAGEVVRFLESVSSLKSRAAATTAYAAGLRASEVHGAESGRHRQRPGRDPGPSWQGRASAERTAT
jgi:integrase